MNKLRTKVEGFRTFFGEVFGEMKKSAWPQKQELIGSTIVVIVSVLMLAVFVGISDKLLILLLTKLLPSGG